MKITLALLVVQLIGFRACFGQDVDILRVGDSLEQVESLLDTHALRHESLPVREDGKLVSPDYSVFLRHENCELFVYMDSDRNTVERISFGERTRLQDFQMEDAEQFVFTNLAEDAVISVGDGIDLVEAKLRESHFVFSRVPIIRSDVEYNALMCIRFPLKESASQKIHMILWRKDSEKVETIISDGEPTDALKFFQLKPAFRWRTNRQ